MNGSDSSRRAVRRHHQRRRELLRDAEADRLRAGPEQVLVEIRERLVDDLEQEVVLPAAERPRGHEHDDAEDQPRSQLAQVLDERQPVLIADRPDARHGTARR